jgi:hypothetical protein
MPGDDDLTSLRFEQAGLPGAAADRSPIRSAGMARGSPIAARRRAADRPAFVEPPQTLAV